MMMMTIK